MKFALTILLTVISLTAWGQNSGKVLSYQSFAQLGIHDRADYIETMRAAALKTEREQNSQPIEGSAQSSGRQSLNQLFMQALLGRAWATAGDTCIYAGYISQRNAQDRCDIPQALTQKTWSININGQVKTQALCTGSGQVLCNPMLYGFGPSAGGICTTNRSYPTADCEKQYQALPNYKAYNVANQLVDSHLKSEFDAQAAKLNSYCSSPQSTQQKSICKSLQEKTAFMQAKIEAAELRRKASTPASTPKVAKKTEIKPSTPSTSAPAVAPTAQAQPEVKPRVETVAPTSSPSIGGSDGGTASAAAAPTPPKNQVAAAPVPPADIPNPPKEKAAPKVEKKAAPSKDGCIHNAIDYAAYKDKLPKQLQSVDKTPFYLKQDDSMVTGGFKVTFVNGQLKILTALWPLVGKTIVGESYTTYVCIDPNNPKRISLITPGKENPEDLAYIDFSKAEIIVGKGNQSHNFDVASSTDFNAILNKVETKMGTSGTKASLAGNR